MLTTVVIPVVVGLIVGVLSGLLGVGGGTIMVPALRLLFGMSPTAATATSLFAIIPTSISGVAGHLRNKTCFPKLGIAAGLGGACTSPLGVWLGSQAPGWAVMLAVSVVIAWSSYKMFRQAFRLPKNGAANKASGGNAPDDKAAAAAVAGITELSRAQLIKGFFIGLLAGGIAGFVGLGGGFLMVPLFVSVLGLSMKQTSGTSLIAVMILAIPGTITNAMMGNVEFVAGIAMVCGTIPGAFAGAKFSKRVPERTLRLLFGTFLLFCAALLVAKEFGILG